MTTHEVLVLDESLAVQSDLRDAFERRGYRVLGVRDESSARRAFERGTFGAAVFGIDWNRVDGRSGSRELLQQTSRECPVVVLSESERIETRISVLRERVADFIAKPYNPGYVVKRVHEAVHGAKTPAGPNRILVVDDSATYGHAVAQSLIRDGHDVVLAKTGKEAEDYLAVQTPDAVFLDVFLPDVDGIELAKRIRTSAEHRYLPILMLTGRESTSVRTRAVEANVSAFAAKNTPLDELRARVPELVAGGRKAPVRADTKSSENNALGGLRGEALFERVVAASGLSAVLGRSTLTLGLKRAGTEPGALTPARLRAAMPQIEQVLTTFVHAGELQSRLSAVESIIRESEGSR